MGDRSRSAERLKTPGNKSVGTPKLPSVRPPTRAGGVTGQKSHAGVTGNSNPNYTEREQEKLMSKWRVNVSRSRLCESAKCSFGGWRCPECVKEIVFGHCLLFEEMEGKVNRLYAILLFRWAVTFEIVTAFSFCSGSNKSGKFCKQTIVFAFCWRKVMFEIRRLMSLLQNFTQQSSSRRLQCKRCNLFWSGISVFRALQLRRHTWCISV